MKRSNLAGLILMIVLLYPLSYGPVMRWRQYYGKYPKDPRIYYFYEPLTSAPWLGDVINDYGNFCVNAFP